MPTEVWQELMRQGNNCVLCKIRHLYNLKVTGIGNRARFKVSFIYCKRRKYDVSEKINAYRANRINCYMRENMFARKCH